MEYIYVLRLEDDHYYVGKTNDLARRFMQHINGEGSKWTQVYKPSSIIHTQENRHDLDEEMCTLEWMDKKGIDMVRGDCFTNLRLSDDEKAFIRKKINTMKNQCYLCNELGHFINECPKNKNTKEGGIELLSINDLKNKMRFTWLVKGLIAEKSLVCMYGVPGCGKTFMALDIGLHIAHGMQWNNYPTGHGLVFYIVAEGVNGIYNRIKAWHSFHNTSMDEAGFFIIEMYKHCLHKRKFSEDLIKIARAQEKKLNIKTRMIIIDTLSHALNGLDENSSTEVSKLLKEMLYINSELGATTMFVHHSNKRTNEIRGSSAILAAVDTSISIKRIGNEVSMNVDKQKDGTPKSLEFFIKLNEKSCVMRMV